MGIEHYEARQAAPHGRSDDASSDVHRTLSPRRIEPPCRALEAESIFIMREVAAEFERPVAAVLRRQGLDRPAAPRGEGLPAGEVPVPGHARRHRPQLPRGARVPRPARGRARRAADRRQRPGVASTRAASGDEPGHDPSRNRLQTTTLLDAIQEHQFDAVFGGARRDEEKARAKERIFSFRDEFGQWEPQDAAARAVEPLQRPDPQGRAHARLPASPTGPRWTSGSTSSARASRSRSIYFAHERDVFKRDGMWLSTGRVPATRADDERSPDGSSASAPSAT